MYEVRRRRLTPPMYDVRGTTEAPGGAYVRGTMYDVRLPNSRALRGGAERGRTGCRETVRGDSYKGAVAADAAHVRCTMDDVRFGKFPRLRASVAKQARGLKS